MQTNTASGLTRERLIEISERGEPQLALDVDASRRAPSVSVTTWRSAAAPERKQLERGPRERAQIARVPLTDGAEPCDQDAHRHSSSGGTIMFDQELVARQEGPEVFERLGHHRSVRLAHGGQARRARLLARRHHLDHDRTWRVEQLAHAERRGRASRIDPRVRQAVRLDHAAQRRQRDAARRVGAGEPAEIARLRRANRRIAVVVQHEQLDRQLQARGWSAAPGC